MMEQLRSLVRQHLKTMVRVQKPLAQLLAATLMQKNLMPAKASSYFCTTRLPDFKEVVYQFDSSKIDYSLQWLLGIQRLFIQQCRHN